LKIDKLPFFYKVHENSDNGGYPQILEFDLYFDNDFKMFRQKAASSLRKILKDVYLEGSLAEGSISNESGEIYLNEISKYILSEVKNNDETKILEIGYGSGILLKKLRNSGVKSLYGIEPGNHIKVDGLDDIILINDFFPTPRLKDKFDLIISFSVLEHIEDINDFIIKQSEYLSEKGKIIFSVPNCEPYLMNGDLSILIHEHFNYFTKDSIIRIIGKAGLFVEDVTVIQGSLTCKVSKINSIVRLVENKSSDYSHRFNEKIDSHLKSLNKIFKEYQDNELAIYAPIRAMNSLFFLGYNNFRLIDDNSEMHSKYLPFLRKQIESFQDILDNPPKCILVFSRTFGEKILSKCREYDSLNNVRILTLNDIEVNQD
jgi:2-polyprenyl-3-methyl-5-hydroxy-6-metoxy-1,4-benzoquinol methylase